MNAAQERITRYWDQVSAVYDSDDGHAVHGDDVRDAWLRALRPLLPPPPSDVLDVGTGTGEMAFLLSNLGHRVTGVDLSEGMLALAKEKAVGRANPPKWRVGDAIDPPADAMAWDALVSRHILWTLTDPARAFANWFRLLRPGGTLLVIDGLWFSGPLAIATETSEDSPYPFEEYYSNDVQAALPLMRADSVDPIVALIRENGFVDIAVGHFDEVEALEKRDPAKPKIPPRHVITARRPA